ncbi:MAG: thiolase domain-containing protein [Candidatus Freyarchaeota archaeon]|nr:thiolase domain-containing protein [Candidatus Jordarchaeia archaeon]MBS7280034.1 thiolase domain-containing protein [Candidatus Jordarchaeia archaeon]
MRQVAVIGVGLTKVGHLFSESLRSLFSRAVRGALEDAGSPKIEALYVGNMSAGQFNNQENIAALLSDFAGLNGIPATRIEEGCGSGAAAIYNGYKAVASGVHDFVIVGGVEKMMDTTANDATSIISTVTDQEYEAFLGLSLVGINAMVMRLYMNTFNVDREPFAKFSVQMHDNASKNPYAQFPFKTSLDKAMNSNPVADPIHLMDCAPLGDGAAALVLCPKEYAKDFTSKPVEIIGAGHGMDNFIFHTREDFLSLKATRDAAREAYRMAGITPDEVDVVELHDAFSITAFLSIEDLGFVEKGAAGQLVDEGLIALDGTLPVNPSGGLKARGHPIGATGVYQMAEIVLQLRGEAGARQVPGAEIGLTNNISGFGASSYVHILRV